MSANTRLAPLTQSELPGTNLPATAGVKDWQSIEALWLMKATTGTLTASMIDGRESEPQPVRSIAPPKSSPAQKNSVLRRSVRAPRFIRADANSSVARQVK
jgi:hypothetical protein